MRKVEIKKSLYNFKKVLLKKEDIEKIIGLLEENNFENIKFFSEDDGFEIIYENIDEINDLNKLKIYGEKENYKNVKIDFYNNIIYFSEDFELLGIKIKDILKSKEKKITIFYIKYIFGINLSYILFMFILSLFKNNIIDFFNFILLLINIILNIYFYKNYKHTLKTKKNNFFTRKKDDIVMLIIGGIIGGFFTKIFEYFLK